MNYEVEKSVNEIWTLSSGSYYEDNKYKDSVYTGNDGSSLLAVAVPRDGGNIMSSAHITTLADRFSITQETTVRWVSRLLFGRWVGMKSENMFVVCATKPKLDVEIHR
jgi:hypothetical protein